MLFSSRLQAQNVELTWDQDPTGLVTGYRVFYGTHSGVYTNSVLFFGAVDDVVMSGLQVGTTYYFAVQSNDQQGDISPISNEASYTVPVIQPVSLQMETFPGTTLLYLHGDVVPSGSWELQSSTDMKTWIPLDFDYSDSVDYDIDMSQAPQMYFRVVR